MSLFTYTYVSFDIYLVALLRLLLLAPPETALQVAESGQVYFTGLL